MARLWHIIVWCVLVVLLTPGESTNETLTEIFEYLQDGNLLTVIDDNYKDIVLVIGNSGSGKSTLTQFIAGDSSKLVAVKLEDGQFEIEDADSKINKMRIISKTNFPELVIDNRTNAAFYDCPVFDDTRSLAYDIVTTYLVNE